MTAPTRTTFACLTVLSVGLVAVLAAAGRADE